MKNKIIPSPVNSKIVSPDKPYIQITTASDINTQDEYYRKIDNDYIPLGKYTKFDICPEISREESKNMYIVAYKIRYAECPKLIFVHNGKETVIANEMYKNTLSTPYEQKIYVDKISNINHISEIPDETIQALNIYKKK